MVWLAVALRALSCSLLQAGAPVDHIILITSCTYAANWEADEVKPEEVPWCAGRGLHFEAAAPASPCARSSNNKTMR
jgi:hypothetical protein